MVSSQRAPDERVGALRGAARQFGLCVRRIWFPDRAPGDGFDRIAVVHSVLAGGCLQVARWRHRFARAGSFGCAGVGRFGVGSSQGFILGTAVVSPEVDSLTQAASCCGLETGLASNSDDDEDSGKVHSDAFEWVSDASALGSAGMGRDCRSLQTGGVFLLNHQVWDTVNVPSRPIRLQDPCCDSRCYLQAVDRSVVFWQLQLEPMSPP